MICLRLVGMPLPIPKRCTMRSMRRVRSRRFVRHRMNPAPGTPNLLKQVSRCRFPRSRITQAPSLRHQNADAAPS